MTVGSGTGYSVGSPSSASVTVNDDDAPAATITAGTSPVTEGTAATFTVELSSAAPTGGLTIALTVADASGSDFVASSNEGAKTLAFNASDTSKTYSVATVSDTVDEASGDVKVTVGTGTGYTVGAPSSATVTVNDDDAPAATITATTSPVTEGSAASFTVTLSSAAPDGGLTIALTVADASSSDFVASSNEGSKTLAFAQGDTSKTYSVATVSDTVDEASGAVTVTVGSGTGYTVGTPASASVTVNDDDAPAATIKARTSPVTEGTAATFTVTLSTAAPTGGLTIALTVADASGSDFVASANEGSKTLAFNAGDTSKTYSVATVSDTVDEANGDVTVTVGTGTGYTVGTPSSATITVNDDDAPAATIKAGTSPVTEGTAASFTLELSTPAPTGGLTIALTVADASGSDFVASTNEGSKTLAFNAGDTSKTYSVATVSDTVDEANGDVTVTVGSGTGYTVGSPSSAKVTVNDDDAPAATIKAGTSPVTEGTAASFTVELSTAAPEDGLTIALTVADASGSDFVASANEGSKTLAFDAGDTSKTYTVATVSDTVDEANGDVTVTVGTGTGYTVGSPSSASVTINDDDAPAATIKAGTSPVTEGTAASFTVELSSAAPTGGLSIALTVADASGSDFVASSNEGSKTLAFNAGDTSKTYTVATVADTVDEANGDVTVTVGSGTGYTVGTPSSAKVTVNDDDAPAATIKAGTSPVTEGTAASFTVELSTAAPTGGLTIALTVADASGSDFVASANEGSKTLAFDAGDTSKTYSVATVADTIDEANGDVTVTVGSGTGYTVGSPSSASVTVDDDDAPAATIKAGTSPVTEGTAASFTVELSTAAPEGGLTIALTVADASGSDFVASTNEGSKTLAFNAGDTSKTYSVATVADTVDEANGDGVTVTVGSGTGYTVGSPSSASVTVNDDDNPAATIKAGTSPVTEGTAASFTVELSTAAPTGGLTIALTVADASGSDFVASSNEGSKTLAFNAGDTSKTYSVATVADTVDEANGDVTVTVGTGTGYTVGSPSSASVTVNDDDAPAATIKAGTSPVTEGTAASFTVQLSTAAPEGGLSIALTVADASGSDFVASTNEGAKTLAFNAGDTSKTYSVATVSDTVDEANGDVKVTVGTGTGYTVGTDCRRCNRYAVVGEGDGQRRRRPRRHDHRRHFAGDGGHGRDVHGGALKRRAPGGPVDRPHRGGRIGQRLRRLVQRGRQDPDLRRGRHFQDVLCSHGLRHRGRGQRRRDRDGRHGDGVHRRIAVLRLGDRQRRRRPGGDHQGRHIAGHRGHRGDVHRRAVHPGANWRAVDRPHGRRRFGQRLHRLGQRGLQDPGLQRGRHLEDLQCGDRRRHRGRGQRPGQGHRRHGHRLHGRHSVLRNRHRRGRRRPGRHHQGGDIPGDRGHGSLVHRRAVHSGANWRSVDRAHRGGRLGQRLRRFGQRGFQDPGVQRRRHLEDVLRGHRLRHR